ncbi:MAG: hypothetical protein Q8O17_03780, partial [Candidatus Methanoperedens sp.]|nr:hypothetical protein [Candidatus Methanoperedens sp.]
ILSKIIVSIILIVAIMTGTFYVIGQQKHGSVMDLRVYVFIDNEKNPHIVAINGSLRDVNAISLPKGNEVITPGIIANVIYQDNLIGYWTSEKLDASVPLNSTTAYNLTVGLLKKPAKGDDVSITARVLGFRGEELDSIMTTFKIP